MIIAFHLSITSVLPSGLGHIPFSPIIDFNELIHRAGAAGVFNPNSAEVINLATGRRVEYAHSEDFASGDCGRLEWAITDPAHTEYEIYFETAADHGHIRLRVGREDEFLFGDLARLRYREPDDEELRHFSGVYVEAHPEYRIELLGRRCDE